MATISYINATCVARGHRVAVLRDGKLQQVDTPRNLYDRPQNARLMVSR